MEIHCECQLTGVSCQSPASQEDGQAEVVTAGQYQYEDYCPSYGTDRQGSEQLFLSHNFWNYKSVWS